jgi:membrane-associated HD superfamily phosphohydrolase
MILKYFFHICSLWNISKVSFLYGTICIDDEDRRLMDLSYRIACLFCGYVFHQKAEGALQSEDVFMMVMVAGIMRKSMLYHGHLKRNETNGRDMNPFLSKVLMFDVLLLLLQVVWLILNMTENTAALSAIDNALSSLPDREL